ncbi:MarP family serine protease [Aeromicrobium sp. CTD01-1L150]|uniref:MarP family serine protease n=1 Tax=Aeromicrobium sp. CTD01-1L150 TaxID=3341830 RepID=UPI0035C22E8B
MNTLDVVLVVIVVAYAVSGYVQGFVVNLVATVGLLVGGGSAIFAVPMLLDSSGAATLQTSLLALGLVIGAAAIGQAIGTYIGTDLRGGLQSTTGRTVDAVGGGALSIVTVLVATWALGYSVSGASIPYLSSSARESSILGQVDGVMPNRASEALRAFNRVLDANLFPRYMDPFSPEQIQAIGPPDDGTLDEPGVREAAGSVVKILGQAECGKGIEGSGFVYGPGRVMTNAHVVAGVDQPEVTVGQRRVPGRVVVFDPQLDLAVIATEDLGVPALEFDESGSPGQPAAVLGYPENGPFDARSARIREQLTLRSPDIYDRGEVLRETFSIRGLVRSGNSGGPLISPDGDVLGVIFAASISDSATGYAVTADAAAENAAEGLSTNQSVDTGGCT